MSSVVRFAVITKWTFLALILVIGTVGCTAIRMKEMVGRAEHDVLREWGPPSKSMPDGKGGKVLVYQKNQAGGGYQVSPPTTTGMSNSDYLGASAAYGFAQGLNQPRTFYRMFFLGADGIVYDWSIVND